MDLHDLSSDDDQEDEVFDEIFKTCQTLHHSSYPQSSINFATMDLSHRMKPLRKCIGSGGYSDVYKAALDDHTRVAVKVLKLIIYKRIAEEEYRTTILRFFRELNYWHQLDHPNIARLLGFILNNGQIGLVSAWYTNGNIVEYLQTHPQASKPDLILDVADGVEYLHTHSEPLVHADLKGVNILVAKNGIACLADFGISKRVSDMDRKTGFTTGGVAGTPRWMAPELLEGELPSPASDVYSFAGVIIEICCPGRTPFDYIRTDAELIGAKHEGRPLDRAQYPNFHDKDDLWDLVAVCFSYKPTERPVIVAVTQKLYDEFRLSRRIAPFDSRYLTIREPLSGLLNNSQEMGNPLTTVNPPQPVSPYSSINHQESIEIGMIELLPDQLVIKILEFAHPRDIAKCQRVCRTLKKIISQSSSLLYALQLAMAECIDAPWRDGTPESAPNPQAGPTLNNKLLDLKKYQEAWEDMKWKDCTEVPVSVEGTLYEVRGGLFISGDPIPMHPHLTQGLSFYPLPKRDRLARSPNSGRQANITTSPSWQFGLGIEVQDFQVDPAQDLMVLIERRQWLTHNRSPEPQHTVHLRTLSSNAPHPLSALPTVSFYVSSPSVSLIIQIMDDVVGLFIRPSRAAGHSDDTVLMWNWKTGQVLACLTAPVMESFVFLSQDMFMVPTGIRLPDLLSLDVYRFGNEGPIAVSLGQGVRAEAPKPILVASFQLPPLLMAVNVLFEAITCRCEPAPSYRTTSTVPPNTPGLASASPLYQTPQSPLGDAATPPPAYSPSLPYMSSSPPNARSQSQPPSPAGPSSHRPLLNTNPFRPSPESRLIVLTLWTLQFNDQHRRLEPGRRLTMFVRASTLATLASDLYRQKMRSPTPDGSEKPSDEPNLGGGMDDGGCDAEQSGDAASQTATSGSSSRSTERLPPNSNPLLDVPWSTWGPKHTRWLESTTSRSWVVYSYASKFIFGVKEPAGPGPTRGYEERSTRVRMLDFNPFYTYLPGEERLNSEDSGLGDCQQLAGGNRSSETESVRFDDIPANDDTVWTSAWNTIRTVRSPSLIEKGSMFKDDIVSYLPYREMTSQRTFKDVGGIMIDEERILIVHNSPFSLSVWNV